MISVLPRTPAPCRDKIAVATTRAIRRPHRLAEAGHVHVDHISHRLGCLIARRRPGAAGGKDQIGAPDVRKIAKRPGHLAAPVRGDPAQDLDPT